MEKHRISKQESKQRKQRGGRVKSVQSLTFISCNNRHCKKQQEKKMQSHRLRNLERSLNNERERKEECEMGLEENENEK